MDSYFYWSPCKPKKSPCSLAATFLGIFLLNPRYLQDKTKMYAYFMFWISYSCFLIFKPTQPLFINIHIYVLFSLLEFQNSKILMVKIILLILLVHRLTSPPRWIKCGIFSDLKWSKIIIKAVESPERIRMLGKSSFYFSILDQQSPVWHIVFEATQGRPSSRPLEIKVVKWRKKQILKQAKK